jgi:excisionase family DNA binding protein
MSRSTAAPPPRLLTVAQAAEHLGTTPSKLYELVAKRSIPSVRIGRAIRIPQDDLDRLGARAGKAEVDAHLPEHQRKSRSAHHLSEGRQPDRREAAKSDTCTCTLVLPVNASRRSPLGRRGHEQP